MSSIFSIVPRASTTATVVLGAMCMMSSMLPCAHAQNTDETSAVTEEPESTQASLPETPVPTVALNPGRYVKSVVTAEDAIIPGNFSVFFQEDQPELKEELKKSLEEDFERGLEGRSRSRTSRRQEENEVVESSWDVVVSNLRTINGNTELEFDVQATQTRLADAEEEVIVAPPQALEDFNEQFNFSKSKDNAPMASLDELYTQTTGTAPRDSFTISRATVNETVDTETVIVTEAPAEIFVGRGTSISKTSIIVPSVLGGVCLSALIALAAVAMFKRRQSGQAQPVKAESSQNEPYGENEVEQKEKANPLVYEDENDAAFSPVEATENPYVTESY